MQGKRLDYDGLERAEISTPKQTPLARREMALQILSGCKAALPEMDALQGLYRLASPTS